MFDEKRETDRRLRRLLLSALRDDHVAYEKFLREARAIVTRYFRRVNRGTFAIHELEEIVQEVLLKLHQRRFEFRLEAPVVPWILVTAKSTYIDHYRILRRQSRKILHPGNPPALALRELWDLSESLPEEDRDVIWLVTIQGLSYKEAARALAVSEHSLRHRLRRALERIRREHGE